MVGGTMGLFAGASIISLVEVIFWAYQVSKILLHQVFKIYQFISHFRLLLDYWASREDEAAAELLTDLVKREIEFFAKTKCCQPAEAQAACS